MRTVPAAELPAAIDADTDVVAFSAVQMASGEVADLDAISAAARHHGAMTVVDATQACGWLPLRGELFDVVAAAGYKWLLSPRGTAYMYVAPGRLDGIAPTAAGWFAGEDLARLVLRAAAPPRPRRPATRHVTRLAQLGRRGAGARRARGDRRRGDPRARPPARKPVPQRPRPRAGRFGDRLRRRTGCGGAARAAGVRAAVRGGRVRTSWHVYNTDDDVDRALDALT